MTDNATPGLPPRSLEALTPAEGRSLVAYLNLPPVGAYADALGPPDPTIAAGYELAEAQRRAIGERRSHLGGVFSELGEIVGVDGVSEGELTRIADRIGVSGSESEPGRYGNSVRPVWGGPESYRELFALLETAEHHIHIEMYIIGGNLGLELADALCVKAKQGVQVRVLFTASGFVMSGAPSGGGLVSSFSEIRSYWRNDRYMRKRIIDRMREGGVEVIDSSPIGSHWRRTTFRKKGVRSAAKYYAWCREQQLPDSWIAEQQVIDKVVGRSLPYVDHRKMIIVDGKRCMTGSMNLDDAYFYPNELSDDSRVNVKRWQWHDNGLIVEGPTVAQMNKLFARRFILSGGTFFDSDDSLYMPAPERAGDAVITQVATGPGLVTVPMRKNWGRLLLTMIGFDKRPITEGSNPIRDRIGQLPELAQSDLYVEHCYPSDAELLMRWGDIIKRRADGPKYTLLFPKHYDTAMLGLECDRFFPELLAAGAAVYGYEKAIMHSKVAVADGFYVATGSFNLTIHSARMALEQEFFIQDRTYGHAVRDRIQADLRDSRPVEPSAVDRFRSKRSIPIFDALLRFFFY
ncbi:MAG: phosphatidylserine/phosphatidylglycerophosphate/cardiolipin synthase-like enzyme [Myxococcota bacterium]|jgi:phosphatidylserine/phosphatidylglycerophosphate/cardiolipin synthase-like enzyme